MLLLTLMMMVMLLLLFLVLMRRTFLSKLYDSLNVVQTHRVGPGFRREIFKESTVASPVCDCQQEVGVAGEELHGDVCGGRRRVVQAVDTQEWHSDVVHIPDWVVHLPQFLHSAVAVQRAEHGTFYILGIC